MIMIDKDKLVKLDDTLSLANLELIESCVFERVRKLEKEIEELTKKLEICKRVRVRVFEKCKQNYDEQKLSDA